MPRNVNQNLKQLARNIIDFKLDQSAWIIQKMKLIYFCIGTDKIGREYQTDIDTTNCVFSINIQPVGIVETTKVKEEHYFIQLEDKTTDYSGSSLKYLKKDPYRDEKK